MLSDDLFFGKDLLIDDEQPEKLSLKEGELREVSVLFADIKGFTSISNLFEPEVIHGKMDEIMKIFTRCINFYGGFVDKYIGDGIMALFGAKKASEHDTQRAILAAIKMQEQLRLYNNLLAQEPGFENLELGLRIGINTGVVSVGKVGQSREGDFTVYGPEVNLASRMESNAPTNRIMMPNATKVLVDHIFDFEHQGAVMVKGMEEPIDSWLVIGQKSSFSPPPETIFIGRDSELAALREAYQKSQSGFSIFGIEGEAGMGKSRLVQEFCANLPQSGVLKSRCSAIAPSPFNLFSRLFEELFGMQPEYSMQQKKAQLEAAFERFAVEGADREALQDALPLIALLLEIRYDDPRVQQKGKDLLNHILRALQQLFEALLGLGKKAGQSMVLVFDDLHLIDDASAMALEHLLQIFKQETLLMIVLFRQDYPILECIKNDAAFSLMQLPALDSGIVQKLIEQYTSNTQLAPQTVELVKELAAGNPFYIEEWCNYISSLPKTQMDEYPVPSNIHALILSRLDNLPAHLRLLLYKASVIGNEFFVEILREVELRLSDQVDVDETLQELEQHSLIMRILGFDFSSYHFKNISTREVAYQTLLQQNRKMLHQLTAEAIEKLFSDRLDEYAYVLFEHYQKAELYDKALPYMKAAFDQAARVFDNASAIRIGQQLLAHLPLAERAELRIRLADIKWIIGMWKEADIDIQAAEADLPAQDPRFCEIHRFKGMAAFFRGDFELAKMEFTAGFELATKRQDALQICIAHSNLGIWHQHHGHFDEAFRHHEASLELARQLSENQRQAKTLSNMGLIHLENKEIDKAIAAFTDSLQLAQTHRYMRDESIALGNLGWTYLQVPDYDKANSFLQKKLSLAQQMNDKIEIIKALGNLGNIHYQQKDYHEALRYYETSLKLKQELGNEREIQISKDVIADTLKQIQMEN